MSQKDFLDSILRQTAEQAVRLDALVYLDFAEPVEQKFCEREIARYPQADCRFFGGHLYCERKMLCVLPKGADYSEDDYPIETVHITKNKAWDIAHRDVLGSLLALGIERNKIGDINISDELIQIFLASPMGDFVSKNLYEISRYFVNARLADKSDVIVFEPSFSSVSVIIPSMRLDVLIHAVYKLSRSEASDYIKGEKVYINHTLCQKPSVNLKNGDIISVRTKGRFIVDDIAGNTKKGNLRLNLRKFE